MSRNALPSMARDIDSHSHFDSMFSPMHDFHQFFDDVPFSDRERWELAELFSQFYILREMADFSHRDGGNAHVSSTTVNHGDLTDINKKINTAMIPAIAARIMEILTPPV